MSTSPDTVPPLHVVRPLSALASSDVGEVGGKAHSLGRLHALGMPVPPGFVVTSTGWEQFSRQPALARLLATAAETLKASGSVEPHTDMLDELRRAIRETALPADLAELIGEQLSTLGDGVSVAVRSSGSLEDNPTASFAGVFETILNVKGLAGVEAAVKQCWSSFWHPRALAYSLRHDAALSMRPAVVIQVIVPAIASGVLFTVDPTTGREETALIEAVRGLGELLVSGKVTPARFLVSVPNAEILERHTGAQRVLVQCDLEGTKEVAVEGGDGVPVLSDEAIARLTRFGLEVQEAYGRPMDIEWAIDGQGIWLLQARPITSLSFAPSLGEWSNADFREGGVAADVCCQFMWSLYEKAYATAMVGYLKEARMMADGASITWSRMFFGRPYWNLGKVREILQTLPGFSEKAFFADQGIVVDDGAVAPPMRTTLSGLIKAIPVVLALRSGYRRRLELDEEFRASFGDRKADFEREAPAIASLSSGAFRDLYRRLLLDFYVRTETSYFQTIYCIGTAKSEFQPILAKVHELAGGTLDQVQLLTGLNDVSHVRMLKHLHDELRSYHDGGKAVDDELVRRVAERWRHHSRKELDIRVPRWVDDHASVRTFLEGALAAFNPELTPDVVEQRQREVYTRARGKALEALRGRPWLRRSFLIHLERVRKLAWWREEMRDMSTYAYHLVRRWTVDAGRRLAASGHLEASEHVWDLKLQHVLAALADELDVATVRGLVKEHQRILRSFRSFETPNEVWPRHRWTAQTPRTAATGDTLTGIGCSSGIVEGTAHVAQTLDEALEVRGDAILVAVFTDPGWTPLFSRLKGVVTETGGVLSHAAVISREYGIPAVLAVTDVTSAVKTGDRLCIDGSSGVVTIVRRAAGRPSGRPTPNEPNRAAEAHPG